MKQNAVDHPSHYGGDSQYETIKVIDAWGLDFSLGNAVKYISRAGKKEGSSKDEDIRKAIWYLKHSIGEDKAIGDVPVKMQKYRDAAIKIIGIVNNYRPHDSVWGADATINSIIDALDEEGLRE